MNVIKFCLTSFLQYRVVCFSAGKNMWPPDSQGQVWRYVSSVCCEGIGEYELFIRHVIRTLIRVGAAGCETFLFSLWGGKYVREKSHLYFQTHSVCFIQLFMNYFLQIINSPPPDEKTLTCACSVAVCWRYMFFQANSDTHIGTLDSTHRWLSR